MASQNDRPENYRGPRTKIAKWLVAKMLNSVLPRLSLAIDGDGATDDTNSSKKYILHPPTLIQTIHLVMFPDFWVGAYYTNGQWYLSRGDLADFMLELMHEAPSAYAKYVSFISRLRGPFFLIRQYLLTPIKNRQVATHYETDSSLYESFLDSEMVYTCAFFNDKKDTLESAQELKKLLVSKRLKIENSDIDVLDIGCGWGGFERFLVKRYSNLRITGINLSPNQLQWARDKDSASLSADQNRRIIYEISNYYLYKENQSDIFERIIAIGVFEHVGKGNHGIFASNIKRLLRKEGICLVHTIISPLEKVPSNKWFENFIFPGGYAASLSELIKAFEMDGLLIEDVYVHNGDNYYKTLEQWRIRFLNNWMTRSLSYDQQVFARLWHFYLSVARNMFRADFLKYQIAQIAVRKL